MIINTTQPQAAGITKTRAPAAIASRTNTIIIAYALPLLGRTKSGNAAMENQSGHH